MSSPPIDSTNEDLIGGVVAEGELSREEHSITTIEDGLIRKQVRRVIRFFGCGDPTTTDIGGRCSVCDAIVCRNCFRLCNRCRRSLCNNHQRMKNGKAYCDNCHLFVIFLGDRSDRPQENRTDSPQQNQSNLHNTRTRNRSADWFRLLFGE